MPKSKCLYEVHFERDFSFWISQNRASGKIQLDFKGFIFSRARYSCAYCGLDVDVDSLLQYRCEIGPLLPQVGRKYKVIQHIELNLIRKGK